MFTAQSFLGKLYSVASHNCKHHHATKYHLLNIFILFKYNEYQTLPLYINTTTSSDLLFLYLHTSGEEYICPSANQKLRDNAL